MRAGKAVAADVHHHPAFIRGRLVVFLLLVAPEHLAAGRVVKEEGRDNDLLERLAQDERLPFSLQELEEMLGNYQEFTGRAKEQTAEFLQEVVKPCLDKYRDLLGNYDTSLSV